MPRIVIDVQEELEPDDLQRFLQNLEAEPWFECEIELEADVRLDKEIQRAERRVRGAVLRDDVKTEALGHLRQARDLVEASLLEGRRS